jgi:hypothetical protein
MITTRKSLTVVSLFLGLTSCNSFNHTTMIVTDAAEPKRASAALATASLSDEAIKTESSNETTPDSGNERKKPSVTAVCPIYKLPPLPREPDLPYDKLAKLTNSNDPHAFDQVAEDQIKALYMYIGELKKRLRDSHQQYLKDCQDYLSGHQISLGQ